MSLDDHPSGEARGGRTRLTNALQLRRAASSGASVALGEAGNAQPTLEGIRKLAKALRVSADALVFETTDRGPDEEFRLQFEALTQFNAEDKRAAKAVLHALILKHQARKWAHAS